MKEFENTGECSHSHDLISYVYNEMDISGRDRFDSHLADCSSCIEELANLSLSFYSVHEWRKLEFDPLPTPYFQLPAAKHKASFADRLWDLFSPAPGWVAAGSLAALLLTATIGILTLKDSSNPELAGISEIGEVPVASIDTNTGSAEVPSVETYQSSTDLKEPRVEKTIETDSPAKSEPKQQPKTLRNTAPVRTERGSTAVLSSAFPQLTEFDELQDDSLRLSDIFDDIDTSD
jgi:hypothetical protein